MKRFALLLLLLMGLFLITGCARTVETQGEILEMHVHMEFMGPVDTSQFRYLLIFSPTQIPNMPTGNISIYFPTPGRSYDEVTASQNGGIQSYYRSYYSSWSDYILINSTGTLLFPSKSTAFSATTTNNASYQFDSGFAARTVITGTTIDCRFFIQSLSPSAPTTLYMTFATSHPQDGTQTGILQDYIDDDISILVKSGQKIGPFLHAPMVSGTPLGASLKSWYVEVL